MHPTLIKH